MRAQGRGRESTQYSVLSARDSTQSSVTTVPRLTTAYWVLGSRFPSSLGHLARHQHAGTRGAPLRRTRTRPASPSPPRSAPTPRPAPTRSSNRGKFSFAYGRATVHAVWIPGVRGCHLLDWSISCKLGFETCSIRWVSMIFRKKIMGGGPSLSWRSAIITGGADFPPVASRFGGNWLGGSALARLGRL